MTDPRMTPTNNAPVTVEQLEQRKAVNAVLGALLAPLIADPVQRITAGNEACTLILSRLAALASAPAGDDRRKVLRLTHFMAEQAEREAVVDWLRKTGDSMKPGTEWRAYYAAAEAIETEQHLPAALTRPRAVAGERGLLEQARDAIKDMLREDDGQAWKEARKLLPRLDAALQSPPAKVEG